MNALLADMKETDKELDQAKGEFVSLLKELTSNDETAEVEEDMETYKKLKERVE